MKRTMSCGVLLFALPLLAHHSFEAEYDFNKQIKLTGTVTKMEWMNPHAHFYVDSKDESGAVTHWNFELGCLPILPINPTRSSSTRSAKRTARKTIPRNTACPTAWCGLPRFPIRSCRPRSWWCYYPKAIPTAI